MRKVMLVGVLLLIVGAFCFYKTHAAYQAEQARRLSGQPANNSWWEDSGASVWTKRGIWTMVGGLGVLFLWGAVMNKYWSKVQCKNCGWVGSFARWRDEGECPRCGSDYYRYR